MARLPQTPPSSAPFRALLERGVRLHQQGDLAGAVSAYRGVLAVEPKSFDALHMLGVALVQLKQPEEGLSHLRKALRISPNSAACQINLANALIETRQFAEAERLFRSILASGRSNEAALRGLLQCLNELGRHEEAIALGGKAEQFNTRSAELFNELGRAQSSARQFREAAVSFKKALNLKPGYATAACNLGNALTELKLFEEAETVLTTVLKSDPNNVDALTNLAHMHRTNWQAEKAIDAARQAIRLKGGDPGLEIFIAGCFVDLGRNSEAEAIFREMLQRDQNTRDAVIGLSQIHKFLTGDPEIELVDRLLSDKALAAKDRKPLLFTKAKIEDDLGHFEGAIANAISAKAIDPHPGQMDEYRSYVSDCMRLMDRPFFAEVKPLGNQIELPVFVLGMPRSGTTLTEQIIASHAQADGAGELTALAAIGEEIGFRRLPPQKLAERLRGMQPGERASYADRYLSILQRDRKTGALRITDKLPNNFENIWLVALLFPNARIIHCNRNPVDVCISIFLRNFSAGHWYSQDLATLGQYYQFYRQQVLHWKETCGLRWYDNDYEQLVADPEPNIRRMIDFLGLPWDEKCLSHSETARSVHTFSKAQVRQPIYKTSVEKWKHYAPYIGPLLKELGIPAP